MTETVHSMPCRRVGLLLYPGCMPAGLFAAADLMSAASLRAGRPVFETSWVALRAGDVACAQGMALHPTNGMVYFSVPNTTGGGMVFRMSKGGGGSAERGVAGDTE